MHFTATIPEPTRWSHLRVSVHWPAIFVRYLAFIPAKTAERLPGAITRHARELLALPARVYVRSDSAMI
jgi:hypothetical protein